MLYGLPSSAVSVPDGLATGATMFPLYLLVLISTRPGLLLPVAVAALLLAHPLAVTAPRAAAAVAASSRPRWRRGTRVSTVIRSLSRPAGVALRVLGEILPVRPGYLDRAEPHRLQPGAARRAGRAGDL